MYFFLDGVPLKDPDGRWNVMVGTVITPSITKRTSAITIPGVTGMHASTRPPLEAPQLPIEIRVKGHSKDDMIANWTAIMGLFSRAKKLTRVPSQTPQHTAVELVSVAEPEYNVIQHTLTAKALVRLNDAYWLGEEATWQHTGVAGTHVITTLDNATAPNTRLQIRIKGPATNPKVIAGDTWCSVQETLTGGDFLVIDCALFTARKGAADWDSGGTSVVLETSGGAYALFAEPEMQSTDPRQTRTRLTLAATDTTSATQLHVRGRPAYL